MSTSTTKRMTNGCRLRGATGAPACRSAARGLLALGGCVLLACAHDTPAEGPNGDRASAERAAATQPAWVDPHVPGDPLPADAIHGADADADHIRDDVEAYIDRAYAQDEKQWLAARQLARAFQHQLAYRGDALKAQATAHDIAAAITCLNRSGLSGGTARAELLARTLDNAERLRAYHAFQRRIAGTYITIPRDSGCEHHGGTP